MTEPTPGRAGGLLMPLILCRASDPATHHGAGERITVRTTNGGEITGVLLEPLSFHALHHRLGAEAATLAVESWAGGHYGTRIPCNRIAGVTVHYRTLQGATT